jgi:hypothetical protein
VILTPVQHSQHIEHLIPVRHQRIHMYRHRHRRMRMTPRQMSLRMHLHKDQISTLHTNAKQHPHQQLHST